MDEPIEIARRGQRAEEDRREEEALAAAEERERRREQDDQCKHAEQRSVEREERMTGQELHRRLFEHYADNGLEDATWEEMEDRDHLVWELLAESVVDRAELTSAFDRIGGLPDRNSESPEAFSERVEATDAHRIAFDVALILTQDA
jgi:hypothetical protein